MIKVSEFVEQLLALPQNAYVLVSNDAEGNSIRAFDAVYGPYLAEKDGHEFWLDGDGDDYVVVWPV